MSFWEGITVMVVLLVLPWGLQFLLGDSGDDSFGAGATDGWLERRKKKAKGGE